jgi:hypothetical protein
LAVKPAGNTNLQDPDRYGRITLRSIFGRAVSRGAWGEAVYAGPSVRFVQGKISKPVTCKFNITGAKLCIYLRVYFYFFSGITIPKNNLILLFYFLSDKVSLCVKYFIHRKVEARGPERTPWSPCPRDDPGIRDIGFEKGESGS